MALEQNVQSIGSGPLVSVIVPTYKRASLLSRALDSILSQSYPNIEVIVVNDNKPATADYLNARQVSADKGVVHISTGGGKGGGAARNEACKFANGEYFAFLDDDDVFLPGKIEKQLTFMVQRHLDMSYQDVEWCREDGRLVERRLMNHVAGDSKEDLLKGHLLTPIAPTAIYMVRRELFEKTEGFGEYPTGQDWHLMLRCIEANGRIGYMPGVYVRQFLHDGDRLSLGTNKIAGEQQRHEFVKSYEYLLNAKERRYVEFRHNAVLMFSCARSGMYKHALLYAGKALCVSPLLCIKEAVGYIRAKA